MAGKKKGGYRIALAGMQTTTHLLVYILLALVILFAARTSYRYGYYLFNEQAAEEAPGVTVTVEIPEGSSVRDIAKILDRNNLIDGVNLFVVQERLSSYHGKLQAGTYRLNSSQLPSEIMAVLAGEGEEAEETTEDTGDTSDG